MSCFFSFCLALIAHLVTVGKPGNKQKKGIRHTLFSPLACCALECGGGASDKPATTAAKAMARQGRGKLKKKNRDMAATQSPIPELICMDGCICEVPVAPPKLQCKQHLDKLVVGEFLQDTEKRGRLWRWEAQPLIY